MCCDGNRSPAEISLDRALKPTDEAQHLHDVRRLHKRKKQLSTFSLLSARELPSARTWGFILRESQRWSYISEERKSAAVLPRCRASTYNSQFPECSSARPAGTSSDPSCRPPSWWFWVHRNITKTEKSCTLAENRWHSSFQTDTLAVQFINMWMMNVSPTPTSKL